MVAEPEGRGWAVPIPLHPAWGADGQRRHGGTVRALIICSEQPPVESGVARAIHQLSAGLSARGHSIDLLTGGDARYLNLGEFRFNTLAAQWPAVRAALADYDVVNIHGPAPTISDAYLGLLRTVPAAQRPRILYTHHFSIDLAQWKTASRLYENFHRHIARLADEIVVPTPSYHSMLSSRRGPAVRLIPWGVDVERFAGERLIAPYDGSRPLRVLFVGQMRPYKGIAELVQAAADEPDLELTVVGKGRLEDHFRAMATSSNTTFVGSVTDDVLTDLYLSHDVVVKAATSRLEAFGLVLLEGMAAGCVPVASDLPGVRDVAVATGRVVPARDVEGLRTALLRLARSPATVRDLQSRSRAEAARYSWESTVDAYEQAFVHPIPKTIDLTRHGREGGLASEEPIKVLYIGGTGRTGSTLIDRILGQYEGIFNAGELAFVWRYGLREGGRCSCGELLADCAVWQKIFVHAYGGVGAVDADEMVELRRRFNSKHLPLMLTKGIRGRLLSRLGPFPERVEHLYRAIHAVTGSRVIVDSSKEPHYSYILKSRPGLDVYFLHLVRDPRAIALSWRRKRREQGMGGRVFMQRRSWLTSAAYFDVSNAAADVIWGGSSDRYLRVRYEDFVSRPAETLDAIGAFVGEALDLDQLLVDDQVALEVTHSAWGNPNRFQHGLVRITPDSAWKEALPVWRRLTATATTFPLMRRYGYPIRVSGTISENGAARLRPRVTQPD
ncbi:MAG TPA: glycosyltransferase [Acidimicrobiia bacterium]|nr:glycosyltransferase [Acidimicrobiia bacterium]